MAGNKALNSIGSLVDIRSTKRYFLYGVVIKYDIDIEGTDLPLIEKNKVAKAIKQGLQDP